MRIRVGDTVKIMAGKDKNKTGLVKKVLPKVDKLIVDKANIVKKHQKPTTAYPQGGIVEKSLPIDVSNVSLVCSNCQKTTRIGYKILENGSKQRVCKACGEVMK